MDADQLRGGIGLPPDLAVREREFRAASPTPESTGNRADDLVLVAVIILEAHAQCVAAILFARALRMRLRGARLHFAADEGVQPRELLGRELVEAGCLEVRRGHAFLERRELLGEHERRRECEASGEHEDQ